VHLVRSKGREYTYHIRGRGTKNQGPRTPLPGLPHNPDGSPNAEWWAAYRRLEGEPEPAARAGTFAALIVAREASPEWGALSEGTREMWARFHRVISEAWSGEQVKGLEPKHVMALRNSYADMPPADPKLRTKPIEDYKARPAAANNLIRCLSATLKWSIPLGWRPDNPCRDIPKLPIGDGYEPWTRREIEFFKKHARQDLWHAAAIALYTGQRQGDVLSMRRNHIRDGAIEVKQAKTGKPLAVAIHPDLRAILAELPRKSLHLLTNTRGKPWTSGGFKGMWQEEMDRRIFRVLRKRGRVFHGLRKSAVVFLLEAGCTDAEVASITGQCREMIEHYARQVNQRKLARAAILKWQQSGAQGAGQ
jgi:integrase